jgi:hypothetical protein
MNVQTLPNASAPASPSPATPAPSLSPRACATCGRPVTTSGPFWLVWAASHHVGCVDRFGRPLPFSPARNVGRRLLRGVRRWGAAPPSELVRAVDELDELARAWPPADPTTALERARAATAVVERWRRRLRLAVASRPPAARARPNEGQIASAPGP